MSDLWDLWERGYWAVIPTNTQTHPDGRAVMGAGLARMAAHRFPTLQGRYGNDLDFGKPYATYEDVHLVLVPTKREWRKPSTTRLISDAVDFLLSWVEYRPEASLVVPALGCGRGGLDWAVVKPILAPLAACDKVVVLPPS